MEKIKFEVGKRYYDNHGKTHTCTKRTDKSVWMGKYRFVVKGYDVERINGAYRFSADNYDDDELQRNRAIKELLQAVTKVCEYEPCEYTDECEEEIYKLSNDLKEYIDEYIAKLN